MDFYLQILQEFCTFIRLFSGVFPKTNEVNSQLSSPFQYKQFFIRLQQVFLDSMKKIFILSGYSEQDAKLVFQAIAEAPAPKDAKEVFRKWIDIHQLSARHSEEQRNNCTDID